MILAAGYGSRLRPLTDRLPKALVEVGGVTMLERIARNLVAAGADRLIVNVHHHSEQIRRFIEERDGFGVETLVSEERDAPLETGGGVAAAAVHFRRAAPFFLHNVDIISGLDLAAMYRAHAASGPLATLAVSGRPSSRLLRFDRMGLQGRVDTRDGGVEEARPARGPTWDRAFAGVHVLSPEIFDLLEESGAYSIMAPYMRLAGAGYRIEPYDTGNALWLEIGNPERLSRARAEMADREGRRGAE
ncbi:MAG: NTP transferase domain-containing protein [Gemmatimonadetes bacterium]|nr:NTP transferase domain-containing protein [Gemmatimonadota bacterium]